MNTPRPTEDAMRFDLHPVDESLNMASYALDKFIFAAPQQCREAVYKVCHGEWGSVHFTPAPVLTAYMAAAAKLVALSKVEDPVATMGALLDICVARIQQAMEHAGMLGKSDLNPAHLLATYLSFVVHVFLSGPAGEQP